MSKLTKFRITLNLMGIMIIILIIYSLIQKDLILDGKLVIESDLTQKIPMMSVLFPEHRVQKKKKIIILFKMNQSILQFEALSNLMKLKLK